MFSDKAQKQTTLLLATTNGICAYFEPCDADGACSTIRVNSDKAPSAQAPIYGRQTGFLFSSKARLRHNHVRVEPRTYAIAC